MDKKLIEEGVRLILKGIGEDIEREGLKKTPQRVADMYEELFNGIGKDPALELEPLFDENHDEMIIVKDIPFYSVCEHHMVPFVGKAHIAYVPNKSGKIVGLSKLSRVLDIVSRRLQVQERLTTIVADTIMQKLQAKGHNGHNRSRTPLHEHKGCKKTQYLNSNLSSQGLIQGKPGIKS